MEYLADFSAADNGVGGALHFAVDELLNFSDETMADTFLEVPAANSGDTSTLTRVESCNSSVSGGGDGHFDWKSFDECQFAGSVPYIQECDAELEWLSNFVEESFSNDDHRFIPATGAAVNTASPAPPTVFPADVSVPGKARSKRSRAAPCDWSSRLLHVAPPAKQEALVAETGTPPRKCLHCASEKTPQWRTGPMGPKTLCNACGVRYKSGRLVQEYRPAASPTFVAAKHSNSHRKVMELRRQKEVQRQQQLNAQVSIFKGCDEFLIHHHHTTLLKGHDLRRMI